MCSASPEPLTFSISALAGHAVIPECLYQILSVVVRRQHLFDCSLLRISLLSAQYATLMPCSDLMWHYRNLSVIRTAWPQGSTSYHVPDTSDRSSL